MEPCTSCLSTEASCQDIKYTPELQVGSLFALEHKTSKGASPFPPKKITKINAFLGEKIYIPLPSTQRHELVTGKSISLKTDESRECNPSTLVVGTLSLRAPFALVCVIVADSLNSTKPLYCTDIFGVVASLAAPQEEMFIVLLSR